MISLFNLKHLAPNFTLISVRRHTVCKLETGGYRTVQSLHACTPMTACDLFWLDSCFMLAYLSCTHHSLTVMRCNNGWQGMYGMVWSKVVPWMLNAASQQGTSFVCSWRRPTRLNVQQSVAIEWLILLRMCALIEVYLPGNKCRLNLVLYNKYLCNSKIKTFRLWRPLWLEVRWTGAPFWTGCWYKSVPTDEDL